MIQQSLQGQLSALKEYFDRSTRALTDEDSRFAPAPGMLTAAEQMAHAAQTVDWFFEGAFAPGGFALDFEDQHKRVQAVKTISEARQWMDRACANGAKVIEQHSDEEWRHPLPEGPIMGGLPRYVILGGLTDHTAHHRGALSVYARLRGKVPPMPYMDM